MVGALVGWRSVAVTDSESGPGSSGIVTSGSFEELPSICVLTNGNNTEKG